MWSGASFPALPLEMTPEDTTSLPSKWRLLFAFAILPLVDALLAFVAYPALWWLPTTAAYQPPDAAQAAPAVAIMAGVLGLLVTICGAVPVVPG